MFSKSNCSGQCTNSYPKQGTQPRYNGYGAHKKTATQARYSFHTLQFLISQPPKNDILAHQQKTIVICASHSNALWGSRWVWAGQEGCMRWCWWRRKKSIFCFGCMREETITLCCCGQDIHQPAKQRHQASDRRIIFHNWQKSLTGLMRGTQIVPWPRKNNSPMNIEHNNELTLKDNQKKSCRFRHRRPSSCGIFDLVQRLSFDGFVNEDK